MRTSNYTSDKEVMEELEELVNENEPDIFKRKRPRKPTNEPNPVRMPGRTKADIGAYWSPPLYTGNHSIKE